jgi:hypothetical protein
MSVVPRIPITDWNQQDLVLGNDQTAEAGLGGLMAA